MAKMDKKWVVLCSSAVAAVYASGFFATESQAASYQPTQHQIQINAQASSHLPRYSHRERHHFNDANHSAEQFNHIKNNNTADNNTTRSNTINSNIQSSSETSGKYKDGTYQGQGANYRGFITVTVSIKNSKIAAVGISDFGMHYPESDVAGLPQEVVQNQSSKVQNVSGATYSTQAFEDAVHNALLKAENA